MAIFADTETAGMWGQIRLIGWLDRDSYHVTEKPEEFWHAIKDLEEVVYFHNLDFDFSKLKSALPAIIYGDFASRETCIINGKIIRLKLRGTRIVLQDSLALLPSSLSSLSKSFDLDAGKIDMSEEFNKYGGAEEYFKNVPINDAQYREYLRMDVYALREVVSKLQEFSGIPWDKFQRVRTLPGLSMRVFQTLFSDSYKALTEPKIGEEVDARYRQAYCGGRVDVYRPKCLGGYHYDVNGLYNYVMGVNTYPRGYSLHATPDKPDEHNANMTVDNLWNYFLSKPNTKCIVTAKVYVPEQFIPPLPLKVNDKLIFPIGEFTGTFVGDELRYAIDDCGVQVLSIEEIDLWLSSYQYFAEFSSLVDEKKQHSRGAERAVWKLFGNSLYGKFGQRRQWPKIVKDTPETRKSLEEKKYPYAQWLPDISAIDDEYLETIKPSWAPYLQVQVAAHITAHARIYVHKLMRACEQSGNRVYYTDTDSIVCENPIPDTIVDDKKAGFWKLEHVIAEGLFVQPKLYAERATNGEYILKNKGLAKEWRATASYRDYVRIYDAMVLGRVVTLYDAIPARRKWLSAVALGVNPDLPDLRRKSIDGSRKQKRRMNYIDNSSQAWTLLEFLQNGSELLTGFG